MKFVLDSDDLAVAVGEYLSRRHPSLAGKTVDLKFRAVGDVFDGEAFPADRLTCTVIPVAKEAK